jgi:hypothetical protein
VGVEGDHNPNIIHRDPMSCSSSSFSSPTSAASVLSAASAASAPQLAVTAAVARATMSSRAAQLGQLLESNVQCYNCFNCDDAWDCNCYSFEDKEMEDHLNALRNYGDKIRIAYGDNVSNFARSEMLRQYTAENFPVSPAASAVSAVSADQDLTPPRTRKRGRRDRGAGPTSVITVSDESGDEEDAVHPPASLQKRAASPPVEVASDAAPSPVEEAPDTAPPPVEGAPNPRMPRKTPGRSSAAAKNGPLLSTPTELGAVSGMARTEAGVCSANVS